ncbi:hypothetical protein K437DRAFT_258379 [Tilletiaria anomala UBC 951]|uniref:Uncharacterized protein n=1 Tax=Tilletiaria anomala (strain ATCC 24038 / CBS 436.72 / UBC 951) TaxID=1037660 RepID=A0A066VLH1_TILAU|nr:uncharacterized protein K437DRAFT_258379 [Tilletiaria anomala UBC 951]KDN41143.1 hypothetical protein K437DRAFT_258379 [Tilletiaria anomala UBC 951]
MSLPIVLLWVQVRSSPAYQDSKSISQVVRQLALLFHAPVTIRYKIAQVKSTPIDDTVYLNAAFWFHLRIVYIHPDAVCVCVSFDRWQWCQRLAPLFEQTAARRGSAHQHNHTFQAFP